MVGWCCHGKSKPKIKHGLSSADKFNDLSWHAGVGPFYFGGLNMKRTDLKGKKFGRLTVIDVAYYNGRQLKWLCKCECGATKEINAQSLVDGKSKSCGCLVHRKGKDNPLWKVGVSTGYERINIEGKRAHNHRIIIEKALGRKLPDEAVTHHMDGNGVNNKNGNLVLCENREYHNLLHARMRAKAETGHPNWMRCTYCKTYDDPKNMYVRKDRNTARHYACQNEYMKAYRDGIKTASN